MTQTIEISEDLRRYSELVAAVTEQFRRGSFFSPLDSITRFQSEMIEKGKPYYENLCFALIVMCRRIERSIYQPG
jgi:hypothetical protein